jgi:hypothetical protein
LEGSISQSTLNTHFVVKSVIYKLVWSFRKSRKIFDLPRTPFSKHIRVWNYIGIIFYAYLYKCSIYNNAPLYSSIARVYRKVNKTWSPVQIIFMHWIADIMLKIIPSVSFTTKTCSCLCLSNEQTVYTFHILIVFPIY